ncbi:hypothetical protein [Actinophytocola sp.]|uniref:hypothetical protein n=1 Tax=Actinophytocola sp. TaxID=1872138 RepID=UPI002D5449C4|nr:hypothetical protein [Actinophytocola sp.]HYQ67021.1 hypothetical protein [Actinophytocola sp.]
MTSSPPPPAPSPSGTAGAATNFADADADAVGPGWSNFSRPVAGDFNGDGITDLAAVEDGSTLNIWNGRGGNRFTAADAIGPGWTPYF